MHVRSVFALAVAAALLAPASMSLQAQTAAPVLKKSAPPLRGTAELGFIQSAKFFEPAEERFAGGMRKGPLQNRFSRAGGLPNEYHVAHDRAA